MSGRRRSGGGFHGFIAFIRRLVEAFRRGQSGDGRPVGGTGGRHRQEQCPTCHRFVRALCADAEEGAEPRRLGLDCGCCTGEHRAAKGAQDGGKFQTSVQRAAE